MRFRRAKLSRTGLWVLLIALLANWATGFLGVKYWRADEGFWRINLYAYQSRRVPVPDILVVGSSRILFGISSNVLEHTLRETATAPSIYSIAQPFGNGLKSAIVLRDVIRSNGCPGMILLEVSPGLVNGGLDQSSFISDYASVTDLPLLAAGLGSLDHLDAVLASSFGGLTALYYHWLDPPPIEWVEGAQRRSGSRWDSLPTSPIQRLDERTVRRQRRRAQRETAKRFLFDFTIEGAPARGFDSIVRQASDCGAQLLFVRLPTLLTAPPEIEGSYAGYMSRLSEENGAPYHDLTRERIGLRAEDYKDFSHLNYIGAARLTRHLAREVLLPLLE